MRQIRDYSDQRNKAWCVHCRSGLPEVGISRDHVPSKALLEKPYPSQLPTIPICKQCNEDFARDEEYFAAFVGCVLSGSTDPQAQSDPRAARILDRSPGLRDSIERSKVEYETRGGSTQKLWTPKDDRLKRVIVKNARGHALYEYGKPMLEEPSSVWYSPILAMTEDQHRMYFHADESDVVPEVGSRMLTRVVTGEGLVDGWVEVQKGVYRYSLVQLGSVTVRSVIREYLATEVLWPN